MAACMPAQVASRPLASSAAALSLVQRVVELRRALGQRHARERAREHVAGVVVAQIDAREGHQTGSEKKQPAPAREEAAEEQRAAKRRRRMAGRERKTAR